MPGCFKYKCPFCGGTNLRVFNERVECWDCGAVWKANLCENCEFRDQCEYYPKLGIPQVQKRMLLHGTLIGWLSQEELQRIKEQQK